MMNDVSKKYKTVDTLHEYLYVTFMLYTISALLNIDIINPKGKYRDVF